MVYLTIAEVARIPICVKDTVSYETGEWKYLELFSFFVYFRANLPLSLYAISIEVVQMTFLYVTIVLRHSRRHIRRQKAALIIAV